MKVRAPLFMSSVELHLWKNLINCYMPKWSKVTWLSEFFKGEKMAEVFVLSLATLFSFVHLSVYIISGTSTPTSSHMVCNWSFAQQGHSQLFWKLRFPWKLYKTIIKRKETFFQIIFPALTSSKKGKCVAIHFFHRLKGEIRHALCLKELTIYESSLKI